MEIAIAQGRTVDHVDQHPGLARQRRPAGGIVGVLHGDEGDAGAVEIGGLGQTLPIAGPRAELVANCGLDLGPDENRPRPGGRDQARLAQGRNAAADDRGVDVSQVNE